MRVPNLAVLSCLGIMLAGCNNQPANGNADAKRDLDQLVQTTKSLNDAVGGIASSSKATADDLRALGGRIDELQKSVTDALGRQKRAALYLALDSDAACDNDDSCANTARAICARINYPNALTSKYTPGVRPTLHALVCYD